MNKMNKKIRDVLKSGNFTIIGIDNGAMVLYEGKMSTKDIDENSVPLYSFDFYGCNSYIPEAVEVLAKILGGKTDSY